MSMEPSRPDPAVPAWWTVVVLIATCTLLVGSAAAWDGIVEEKNGVPYIQNTATPAEGTSKVALEELWRAGGDDEADYLFGVLTQITTDEAGNVYLLDAQLNEVHVFAPSGGYLQSIGRAGDGPGEFRRPSDLFMTSTGEVAILQRMPGKIVLLSRDGEPIGNLPVPQPEDGGMQMFSGGRLAGDHVVLATMRFSRNGDGSGFSSRASLIGVDRNGNPLATYFTHEASRDFASMEIDERTMGGNALVWAADRDGRVFTSAVFDAYEFTVWSADGSAERVVTRAFESRRRSDEEKVRNTPVVAFRRGNRTVRPTVKASDTDRDIQEMFVRNNGEVWVLSSRGAFDAPENGLVSVDVFDGEGRYSRRLELQGEGDYGEDGVHMVGDRVYVVLGLRSAQRAMFGGDDGDASEAEEASPMEVICYQMRSDAVTRQ